METTAKRNLSPLAEGPSSSSSGSLDASEVRNRLDHIYELTEERYFKEFLEEIEDVEELPLERVSNMLMAIYRDYQLAEAYSLLYELNFRRFTVHIYSQIKRYRQVLDPMDVLQDVFLSIYRYPKRFQEDKPHAFRNWTYSIIRNTIFKSLNKHNNLESLPEAFLCFAEDKKTKNPLTNAVEREGMREFNKLYMYYLILYMNIFDNFLLPREKKALHLVEVEEKRYREACEIIGMKLENFKMVVCRARKKILKRMNQIVGENPASVGEDSASPSGQLLEACA